MESRDCVMEARRENLKAPEVLSTMVAGVGEESCDSTEGLTRAKREAEGLDVVVVL